MSKRIKIYGEFYNDTPGGFVASSDQIKDNTSGKSQETINSELYQKNAPKTKYLVCYTGGDVAEKVIEFPGFVLDGEVRLLIQMINPNTAPNPTLNINNTGAKSIYYNGKSIGTENEWKENEILDAYYDGEKYNLTSYTKIIDTLDNIMEYLKTSPDYLDWLERKAGIIPPKDEIWYTTTDGEIIEPAQSPSFSVTSNTYENGKGIIKFDSDVESISGFSNERLTSIILPNSVTTLEDSSFMFSRNLTTVVFGIRSKLSAVGQMAFYDCEALTSINLPNSVTSIGDNAFDSCTGLTSITIPSSVTSIGSSAFGNCTGLTSINISSSVTSIEDYAFSYCTSLTTINIPSSVTSIGGSAFTSCTSLTSITIPNSVTSIGMQAFADCTSLTSITIPESVTGTIENSDVFTNCTSLTSITVDSNNSVYDSRENCNAIIKTSTNELIVGCSTTIIPDSVTSIGSSAFIYCGLTTVTIPNSVTSIGDMAFFSCTELTSITIPSSVTSIGWFAFNSCTGLTSITSLNTTPPTSDSSAFLNTNNCPIYVPSGSVEAYKTAWNGYADRIQAIQ